MSMKTIKTDLLRIEGDENKNSCNVEILGDLTVKGETYQIENTEIIYNDNVIQLNNNQSDVSELGFQGKDPNGDQKKLIYDTANGIWKATINLEEKQISQFYNIVNEGIPYYLSSNKQLNMNSNLIYDVETSTLKSPNINITGDGLEFDGNASIGFGNGNNFLVKNSSDETVFNVDEKGKTYVNSKDSDNFLKFILKCAQSNKGSELVFCDQNNAEKWFLSYRNQENNDKFNIYNSNGIITSLTQDNNATFSTNQFNINSNSSNDVLLNLKTIDYDHLSTIMFSNGTDSNNWKIISDNHSGSALYRLRFDYNDTTVAYFDSYSPNFYLQNNLIMNGTGKNIYNINDNLELKFKNGKYFQIVNEAEIEVFRAEQYGKLFEFIANSNNWCEGSFKSSGVGFGSSIILCNGTNLNNWKIQNRMEFDGPTYRLAFRYNDDEKAYFESGGDLHLNYQQYFNSIDSGSGNAIQIESGKLVEYTSSHRFKENIEYLDNKSLEEIFSPNKLNDIKFTQFNRKKSKQQIEKGEKSQSVEYGIIAEDLYEINKNLVNLDRQGNPYAININNLNFSTLLKTIKQGKEIEELKAENKRLENTLREYNKYLRDDFEKLLEKLKNNNVI